jgi:serine/threonine protein phosphatase PrpC
MTDTADALRRAFIKADRYLLDKVLACKSSLPEKSGASAIVMVVKQESCYIASLGNCRAIMSGGRGLQSYPLYREHTLNDTAERRRVLRAGGRVEINLRESIRLGTGSPQQHSRVYLGDLALTRAFGHFDAKLDRFGGKPRVIIVYPDVRHFKLTHDHDFIVLGSSGTFQSLSNQDVLNAVWKPNAPLWEDIPGNLSASLVDVLQTALVREARENVSAVVVAFEGYVRQCRVNTD